MLDPTNNRLPSLVTAFHRYISVFETGLFTVGTPWIAWLYYVSSKVLANATSRLPVGLDN